MSSDSAIIKALVDALEYTTDELDAWVSGYYANLQIDVYPNNKLKYERDLTPVRQARKILEEIKKCSPT